MQAQCEGEVNTENQDPQDTGDVSDAELVRFLDGELAHHAKAAVSARLGSAPDNRARLDTLTRRSQHLSQLLVGVNPTAAQVEDSAALIRAQLERDAMPRSWTRVPNVLKAAAAIALLLGFGLAVPPVRAWLGEWTRDLIHRWEGARTESDAPAPAPEPAPPAPTADVRVTFTVTTTTFDVDIGEHAGTLIIRSGAGRDGSAESTGVAGASFLVLPNELRIEGPTSPTGIYTIVLPAQVTSVRVRRADRADALHEINRDRPELRIDLSSAR